MIIKKIQFSNNNKKAALTFQFFNIVSDENQNPIYVFWGDGDNSNYWDSTLFHKLNDEIDEHIFSVYEMIKASDEALANAIKPVSRTVITGEFQKPAVLVTKPTKLFEPTIADVFSQDGINNALWSTVKNHANEYAQEGLQYAYYALEGNIYQEPVDDSKSYNCLIRYDLFGGRGNYWFTSPYRDFDTQVMLCDTTGAFYPFWGLHADWTGMAPCFCI